MRISKPTNNWISVKCCLLAAILVLVNTGAAIAASEIFTDTENCLLCHRYPGMGRYDETGKKRVLYINEQNFSKTVHGKLKCTSCHVGLNKIPHTDVKKVDCSSKCHIVEPSTNREFSHANIVEQFQASVHGKGSDEHPKQFAEDLPTCKYCHKNQIHKPFSGLWAKSEALSNETLARCISCHTKKEWAESFYAHFTHRMRRTRSQAEVVKLCTSCHENSEKMDRHGLEGIQTYKDTFHWTQVKYSVKNAPDCISCHVPVGYSAHGIRPRTDLTSPIHISNRINTCRHQGGLQTCHPGATDQFATGRVHAYGIKARWLAGKKVVQASNQEHRLVFERAEVDISDSDVFHYKVLTLIRLFYQIFIPCVIGFMGLHQWLDYLKAKQKSKKAR